MFLSLHMAIVSEDDVGISLGGHYDRLSLYNVADKKYDIC